MFPSEPINLKIAVYWWEWGEWLDHLALKCSFSSINVSIVMKFIDVTFEMEVKTSKLLVLVFAIRFLDI